MRGYWFNKPSLHFGRRPPFNWLILCLVSVLVLIILFGSSSDSFDSVDISRGPDVYSDHANVKSQVIVDYLDLRHFEPNRSKVFDLCGKESENYVPCYNVTANLLAGFKDGEELDRHCQLSKSHHFCLIRPPKDYKIPLSWPVGRDVIWSANVKLSKDQFLSSGSMTKRLMLLEENQISFNSEDEMVADGVKDYSNQIAEMMGLASDADFRSAGVRNVLDIGCGFGSFGAHLLSLKLMVVCVANYESTGSQVQVALERGLPAFIGDFISRQLPLPSLSYDMVHCAQCGISWHDKDGMFLIEIDRILKPGGYFVLTSPSKQQGIKGGISTPFEQFIGKLCWKQVSQQEETFIWKKTSDAECYTTFSKQTYAVCEGESSQSYYKPLGQCISVAGSKRWRPIQNVSSISPDLALHGINPEDFADDMEIWRGVLRNYWSLLSPLIFSDHPKRPGDEDPSPPYNMVRNIMDANARYGGFNGALLEARKSAWVMNVVPFGESDTLPFVLDQGFAGILHDWCEPFPTYPRTYDMIHGEGLLSHVATTRKCSVVDLTFEMDRILRPE
ncbi:hypothetical protein M569_17554, partial [Genlisea aurea]